MNPMRIGALVLIIAGLLLLGYPALSYTTRETVVDIGPLEITTERERSLPVIPIAGGVAIVIGIAMLVSGRRLTA